MPGNLQTTQPTLVLPDWLSTSFSESLSYPLLANAYHDFTIHRSLVVDTVNPARVMRRWSLTRRMGVSLLNGVPTPDPLPALRAFWLSVDGGLLPFFFYPRRADFDPTGFSETGRVVVTFGGPWSHSLTPTMADVPIELVEQSDPDAIVP